MTLEQTVRAFLAAVDRVEREATRPRTGMQVPFHDDFAALARHPSAIAELRRWARRLEEAARRDAFRKLIRDAYDIGARRPEENAP